MEKNKQINSGSSAPSKINTAVNQYGDHSIHAEHIENLTINLPNEEIAPSVNDEGKYLVPIFPVRFDREAGFIVIGNQRIRLPIQLIPIDNRPLYELPYIDAMCEIYAEKLKRVVTPDIIDSLPKGIKRDFSDQREAYYSAECLLHSVRDAFSDGEQQFSVLKEDAFDGIAPTYYNDDFSFGYERLRAVLERITIITLSKSALVNIVGLIGNLEKKGLCHMLVNDGTIKSWVNIDE